MWKNKQDRKVFFRILRIIVSLSLTIAFFKMATVRHDGEPSFRTSSLELNLKERTLTFKFENTAGQVFRISLYVFLVTSTGEIFRIGAMEGENPALYPFEHEPAFYDYGTFSRRINNDVGLDLLQSVVIRIFYWTAVLDENQSWVFYEGQEHPYFSKGQFTRGYSYIPSVNSFNTMTTDQLEKTLKHISETYRWMIE